MSNGKLLLTEAQQEALRLRRFGHTYAEIAVMMGKPPQQAGNIHHLVSRALQKAVLEPAEDVRQIEMMRLEEEYKRLRLQFDIVTKPQDIAAIYQAIDKNHKMRAKICGLDGPRVQNNIQINYGQELQYLPTSKLIKVIECEQGPDQE